MVQVAQKQMTHCKHCGAFAETQGKRRSSPDHRRFFGVINAAFSNWPEGHDFTPDTVEHLRAWLLIKAGHREAVTIPIESDDPSVLRLAVLGVEGALKAADAYAFVRPCRHGFVVFKAKSIAFDKCDQAAFVQVREAVELIIEEELGLRGDDLLKEHGRAA